MSKFKSRAAQVVVGGAAGLVATLAIGAANALAAVEYSAIATTAKTETEAAVTAILPYVGLVLGIMVGIGVLRKLAKAR